MYTNSKATDNYSWLILLIGAIVIALSSFTTPDPRQQEEMSRFNNQIARIFLPRVMESSIPGKCAVKYAIISFMVDPKTNSLDTIRFESNLADNVQEEIKLLLANTLSVDWKLLVGGRSLERQVIKQPILIRSADPKCRTRGDIPANEVTALFQGMLGCAEQGSPVIDQNIYLPLTEMVVRSYKGKENDHAATTLPMN